ncbi:MAG: sugar phosphate nucleotidyltransferase [Thermoplasmataceae archaeon]
MKAVITAAGKGTRSGLDGKIRKEMLPIYDSEGGRIILRPILDRIINNLLLSGIDDVAVVLAHDDQMTPYYISKEFPKVHIIYQKGQHGFGDAVRCASDFVNGERFLLLAGDGMLLNLAGFLPGFMSGRSENRLVLMEVDNPSRYGVAVARRTEAHIIVDDVEEKPARPKSNLALAAIYILGPAVIEDLKTRAENEVELTPSIKRAILDGRETDAVIVDRDMWISVGKAEEYCDILKRSLNYAAKAISSRNS